MIKSRLFLVGCFIFFSVGLNAQYHISKKAVFGGNGDDRPQQVLPIENNSVIGFGYTSTQTTESNGGYDLWAFELDDTLGLVWQKMYGTSSDEKFSHVVSFDQQHLLIGTIDTFGGTVSEHFGETDAWLLMLDNQGNLLWEKTIGNAGENEISKAVITENNDLFLVGTTDSDELMGNGEKDIWLVKMDLEGNILWEQTYGSTLIDEGQDIVEFPAGTGNIAISGYIRSNDGDVTENIGSKDIWVAYLDADGNLLDNQTYGGDKADVPTKMLVLPNNGLAVIGQTQSDWGIDEKGSGDLLLVLIDEDENSPTYSVFGGNGLDGPQDMILNEQGNLVIVGETFSLNGDIDFFYLKEDLWFSEVSLQGELLKSIVLGGDNYDAGFSVVETEPSKYLICAYTDSINGDLSGKTAPAPPHGNHSAWVFLLEPFMTGIEPINNAANANWFFHNNQLKSTQGNNTKTTFQVFNESGQIVLSKQTYATHLDLNDLPLGVYFVEISANNQRQQLKVVIGL